MRSVQANKESARYRDTYTSDSLQLARNAEHYYDELVICFQKLFESLALARISFAYEAEREQKIAKVEDMVTSIEDVIAKETIEQRAAWAVMPNASDEIQARAKNNLIPTSPPCSPFQIS